MHACNCIAESRSFSRSKPERGPQQRSRGTKQNHQAGKRENGDRIKRKNKMQKREKRKKLNIMKSYTSI